MQVRERLYEFLAPGGINVRFWAQSTDQRSMPEILEQRNIIQAAINRRGDSIDVVALAEELSKLPFCNAVQVGVTGIGSSVLIYPEWP